VKPIVPAILAACLVFPVAHSALAASAKAAPAAKPNAAAKPAAVDSVGLLEHAVAQDSSRFDDLFHLGVMYMDRDQTRNAAQVLLKAHQLKPKDVPTLVNLGAAYDALARPADAQNSYREALKIAPGDEIATCRLASSLYARSEYSESVALLRQVIASKPNAHCAYFALGVAFADAGIYGDAVRMWKKVIDLAPDSPEAVSARESISVLEEFTKGNAK
jgi:Flp pilus assembly protein TadD